jgi:hypothetical protein
MINTALQHELLTILNENEAALEELLGDDRAALLKNPRVEEIIAEFRRISGRDAARFQAIIDEHGWPGTSLVGDAGVRAALFLLMHMYALPDFQRAMVPLLTKAVKDGEASAWDLARLEDGIRGLQGRPQKFGTQSDWDENGEMTPYPVVEDPEHVDQLRAEIGLPPLRDELLWRANAMKNHRRAVSPEEMAKHRAEYERWAQLLGWRK